MENITRNIIGHRINRALDISGKKQKELAAFLGVPDNTISYFISGKRTPNAEQIIYIARYLGVSADYLLGLTNASAVVSEQNKIIRDICDYTGLNEDSVELLNFFKTAMFDEEHRFFRLSVEDVEDYDLSRLDFFDYVIVYSDTLYDDLISYIVNIKKECQTLTPIFEKAQEAFSAYKNKSLSFEDFINKAEWFKHELNKALKKQNYLYFCVFEQSKDLSKDYLTRCTKEQSEFIASANLLNDEMQNAIKEYYREHK